jgi:hypothetical protein
VHKYAFYYYGDKKGKHQTTVLLAMSARRVIPRTVRGNQGNPINRVSTEPASEVAVAVAGQGVEYRVLQQENDELKRQLDIWKEKVSSATSGAGSSSEASQVSHQKELNEGQRASIGAYVSNLYKRLKFLNNETLAAYPYILKNALDQLVVVRSNETVENYKNATLREMRYQLSQKRQYSKKQVMKKYLGK